MSVKGKVQKLVVDFNIESDEYQNKSFDEELEAVGRPSPVPYRPQGGQ